MNPKKKNIFVLFQYVINIRLIFRQSTESLVNPSSRTRESLFIDKLIHRISGYSFPDYIDHLEQ